MCLIGGDGTDTADYHYDAGAITVDLSAGTGVGNFADGDTLSEIENVIGSTVDDDVLIRRRECQSTGWI